MLDVDYEGATVLGAYLPGGREVDLRAVPEPEAGPGQAVVAVRASTICGSDLRAIYREHLGEGPEAYQGVIGGHEPCGQVVAVGPGVRRVREGDRVVVYHISGCGQCDQCRRGYRQLTVHGSWVAPVWRMDELLQRLARWDRHPEDVVTDRYPLADARAAYARADTTATGKVAITPS